MDSRLWAKNVADVTWKDYCNPNTTFAGFILYLWWLHLQYSRAHYIKSGYGLGFTFRTFQHGRYCSSEAVCDYSWGLGHPAGWPQLSYEPIWHLTELEPCNGRWFQGLAMSYSNFSDAEWEVIEPLLRDILPKKKRTRPSNWNQHPGIVSLYQLQNGCNWNDLPRDFPPYSTVYWHSLQWRRPGVFDQLMETLHGEDADSSEKKSKWTTLMIHRLRLRLKNTRNAASTVSVSTSDEWEQHLAVDGWGFVLLQQVLMSDDQG